jgi:vacuolar protein sorting-associated protein 53
MDTRIDFDELKQTCLIINTADYCQTTALAVFINYLTLLNNY